MCGISGFVTRGAVLAREPAEARLWRMIATLRHRGPDDEGVWTDGRAGLAHARLSIIDLSPAGHQPMANADGTVWITYNGEIYNFMDLRRELEGLGYAFRSRSDTEVLVHGYAAWGVELAQQAGLTLIGRAKGRRFIALAGAERIVFDSDGREAAEDTARSSRKASLPEEETA